MEKLYLAYIVAVLMIVLTLLVPSLQLAWGVASLVLVWIFLAQDAKDRQLSAWHGAWSLLGIIGIVIYHVVWALKRPLK